MELRDFFSEDAIKLELEGNTKDDILKELIGLLGLDDKSEGMLFKMLKRRENLGSTGHRSGNRDPPLPFARCEQLRVAFGRKTQGLDFKAIDEKPVYFFFLIVAPPLEVSNQYLPVLGKIAQFSKEADVPERLLEAETADGSSCSCSRRRVCNAGGGDTVAEPARFRPLRAHSHSIVAGGFELTS